MYHSMLEIVGNAMVHILINGYFKAKFYECNLITLDEVAKRTLMRCLKKQLTMLNNFYYFLFKVVMNCRAQR